MVIKRKALLVGFLTCLLLMYGCAGRKNSETQPRVAIPEHLWVLSDGNYPDTTAAPTKNRLATLRIEGGVASGTTGCNTYSGPCTLNGNEITFGAMALTKRACPDFMHVEQAFVTALSEAMHYHIEGNTLTITTTTGATLAFRRDHSKGT